METVRICLECRTPLTSDAPQGLCPACLLKQAMQNTGTATIRTGEIAPPSSSGSFPQPGQTFGDYQILRLLGRGGMGEVYEAEHRPSGRRVALKVMGHALESDTDRKRFLREGRLAASISHPHVVYVFGSEEINGRPVIAMELVQGGTLKDRVRKDGPLKPSEAVDAILQMIEGLDAAHHAGILHRDIKPANCFVAPDATVKIGDFGLSVSTIARGETLLTASGSVVGTPTYASPEQLRGEDLDARSDIYSVGASLYYLLTGRPPHQAQDLVKLITEVLDKLPPSPRTICPEIPKGLARVVMRCLAKDRARRFKDYRTLRQALLAFHSAAATPATVGLRFIAGMIDDSVGYAPAYVYFALNGIDPLQNFIQSRTLPMLLLWLIFYLWNVLYYAIPEGLFGAALGKTICGLRVIRHDRSSPGLARALGRALIYTGTYVLPALLVIPFVSAAAFHDRMARGEWDITDLIWLPLFLMLFATMRRRNGYAALQDLATGTRVVARHAAVEREGILAQPEPVFSVRPEANIGVYKVLGQLAAWSTEKLLLGYDEALRRKVWIHVVPAGTPPLNARRRDLSHSGRLRWLNGVRSETEAWDAYEAVEGAALLNLKSPHPWRAVRMWLLDLAEELDFAASDGSLTPLLSLGRVWVATTGKAILLEFPCPGLTQVPPTVPVVDDIKAIQRFLEAVADTALGTSSEHTFPVHVRAFLTSLRNQTFEAGGVIVGNLKSLTGKLAYVSRRRRLASIMFWPAAVALLALLAAALITFEQKRWDRHWAAAYPELPSLRMSLNAYEAELDDEKLRKPFDLHLAGHYRSVLTNGEFWNKPETVSLFHGHMRDRAKRAARSYPEVSPDELAKADALVAPALVSLKQFERRQMVWFVITFVWTLLLLLALIDILVILAAGQAVLLRPFLLTLITRGGLPASRLRLLWRALVAGLPMFVGAPALALLAVSTTEEYRRSGEAHITFLSCVAVIWLVGTLWTILCPTRSLQDRLAGTVVVPR
jgi:uncharacterized RDD family membrane protein YckC